MIAQDARPRFADIVEAADRLSLDEQEHLIDIVRRRVAEEKRNRFIERVEEARAELRSGKGRAIVGGGVHEGDPRMRRTLVFTPAFTRASRRLLKREPALRPRVQATLDMLAANALDPRLQTHKLKGRLQDLHSCTVAYDVRIIFEFTIHEDAEAIGLLDFGTREETY